MKKISAIVTTFNEADNLSKCLESLTWTDELLIMDSFSTDETLNIAKQFNAKIFQHAYDYPSAQKNRIIEKAANDWIILLDADEILSNELILEIKEILSNENIEKDAFWIYRKNFFMHQEMKYSGWTNDKVIRLFQKNCRYKDEKVHEEIETRNMRIGILKNKIIHDSYKSLDHFTRKINRYASYKAKEMFEKKIQPNFYNMYCRPLIRLVKQYFFKLGFLDGKVGWTVSYLSAYEVFMRYALLNEMYIKEKNNLE